MCEGAKVGFGATSGLQIQFGVLSLSGEDICGYEGVEGWVGAWDIANLVMCSVTPIPVQIQFRRAQLNGEKICGELLG